MINQDDIRLLQEISEEQLSELLGVGRSATAPGSESGEEEAASSPPASLDEQIVAALDEAAEMAIQLWEDTRPRNCDEPCTI